ncbi:MAG: peptidoglycan editing factor PgeF [Gammaproteobacteria bacterium]|nr:peptidoglycan editing factor PgeF [Gammaproteobacteria bacterium]
MTGRFDWLPADWPAPPGVVAGTTLRRGGVSRGPCSSFNLAAHVGDADASVAENRGRLRDALELPAEPHWLDQVHGTRVIEAMPAGAAQEADAAYTSRKGVVCAVLTADCLPVLFAARDGSRVAAAHAGWRGLADGVLEATIDALGCAPADLVAWLGPAISQPAFEVGNEVRERFVAADPAAADCFSPNDRGRWQGDLYGLARLRLAARGIRAVHGGARCTFREQELFYSYRREPACGRMASLVFMRDSG